METIPFQEQSIFLSWFCLGAALVTLHETYQARSFIFPSNRKQKLLGVRRIPKLGQTLFLLLSSLFIIVLGGVGLHALHPISLLVCILLYFFVYGQLAYLGHKTNLYPFIMLFLTTMPFTINHSPTFTTDTWPILLIKTSLSMVYFSSFIQKMKNTGLAWIKGNKMKEVFAYHDLLNESNWSEMFNRYSFVLKLIAMFVLLFEASFWLSIFFPEYDLYFGISLLTFHLIILLLFKINYLKYYFPILILYFV